jgi:hypothetical protein
MLVLALASPNFFGDGLLATLAISQQEFDPPVEAVLLKPFSLSFVLDLHSLTRPQDSPQENT